MTTMETKTYDLDYVVAQTNACSARWIKHKLNAGLIPGRKAGRQWYMTESDIAALVEYMGQPTRSRAPIVAVPDMPAESPSRTGLTERARRNLHRQSA